MNTMLLGDVLVVLEEVIAIPNKQGRLSNWIEQDIYLRGGCKVVCNFYAKDNEIMPHQSDPHSDDFLNRVKKEIEHFKLCWSLINSPGK